MKEIKILIQQLRDYPNNFFVYPQDQTIMNSLASQTLENPKDGLVVCDMDGEQQGFIETGGKGEVVIQ